MQDVILADALGAYDGEGVWRDEDGDTRRYRVRMTLEALPGPGLRQAIHHVFHEEDTPDVVQSFELTRTAESILAVTMKGLEPARGYYGRDFLHYALPLPGNLVEVTYVFHPDGTALATGSAGKNAQGRFIMWEERLARAKG